MIGCMRSGSGNCHLQPDCFNAGGQGSGKTTATRAMANHEKLGLVMDGTLQNKARSEVHLEAALAHRHGVEIRFVYCPCRRP